MPQNRSAFLVMTCGPGTMPWMVMAPTISAITALGGTPSVSSGMKEVCAPALLALSGAATPSIAPLPKRRGSVRELFLERIGGERPEHRAIAGQDAEHRADQRAAQHRHGGLPEILARRQQRADARGGDVAILVDVEIAQHLGEAEDAHRQHREFDAVGKRT